jgi:hypothetical protein
MPRYDDALPMRDARARYFHDNAFGDDGGYSKRWVTAKIGPVPFAFPNSAARVRAVKYHDLHHVVTGYDTDWVGEAEIGAWEIASGCAGFAAAWVLNLYAMGIGMLAGAPRAVWRAFARGRHTRNLYRVPYDDALLDARLGAVRAQLGLGGAASSPSSGDRLAFLVWCTAAFALGLLTVAVPIVLLAELIAALR